VPVFRAQPRATNRRLVLPCSSHDALTHWQSAADFLVPRRVLCCALGAQQSATGYRVIAGVQLPQVAGWLDL
jgi:hypothetical protein